MRHDYAREIGERIAHVRGHKSQSAFASEMGVHKNTLGNYERGDRVPDAEFVAGLADRGYNPQWLLTGEGPELMTGLSGGNGPIRTTNEQTLPYGPPPSSAAPEPDPLDKALLADVLMVLREYQDRRSIRWKPDKEAALAAEIYKYMIEQDSPNDEDRQRTLHLVRTLMEGMNVEP